VRFETVAIEASETFVQQYDAAVDLWQDTRDFIRDNGLDRGRVQDGVSGQALSKATQGFAVWLVALFIT
jgi:hypothetical protein